MMRSLVEALSTLRSCSSGDIAPLTREALGRHYVRRVTRRLATALAWVPCLTAERITVNGRTVRNPYTVVAERFEQIVDLVAADAEAGPVHGDPNLSNVICQASGARVRLVDPRAFAEQRAVCGDLSYDTGRASRTA